MMDSASTNRLFTSMLFQDRADTNEWMFQDTYKREHTLCAIQDIVTTWNIANTNNKSAHGRYLMLNGKPIIWDHWKACFRFNCQSGLMVHRYLSS